MTWLLIAVRQEVKNTVFYPDPACGYTINITMHCLNWLLNHSRSVFLNTFILYKWISMILTKISINIKYFNFAKFALK